MKLLLLVDGLSAHSDFSPELLKSAASIHLLHLSPRSNESHFLEKLKAAISGIPSIQSYDSRKLVDFDILQASILNHREEFSEKLKIDGIPLRQALMIQGMNRWWNSPLVESTILKWPLLANLYALTAVQKAFQTEPFDQLVTNIKDPDLLADLQLLAKRLNFRVLSQAFTQSSMKSPIRAAFKWGFNFVSHLILQTIFKLKTPGQVLQGLTKANLFYGFFPDQTLIRGGKPHSKIYGDIPKKLEAPAVYLIHFGAREIFRLPQLLENLKSFWQDIQTYRMVPTHTNLSLFRLIAIYTETKGLRLYAKLKRNLAYKQAFLFNGIDLFNTCDRMMKKALYGQELREDLFHFHSLKGFVQKHPQIKIERSFHFVEFHSWEEAIVQAARKADPKIQTVGIQQSAPDPTLLSFYFTKGMFRDPKNHYGMPDLVLCAGENYRELLNSYEIMPSKALTIGHLTANYYGESRTAEQKKLDRQSMGLPTGPKICFIPCSLEFDLVEGVFILLKDVLEKNPGIHFLVKPHPNTPIEGLIAKYNLKQYPNFQVTDILVPKILPLCDFCISTCTSVSLEAMVLKIPQVHLDVGLLPFMDSLHFEKNLVQDISNSDQLNDFLKNPSPYRLPGQPEERFMGPKNQAPIELALNAINANRKA